MNVYVGYMTSKKGNKYLALAVGDPKRKIIVTYDHTTIHKVAGGLIVNVYLESDKWIEII